MYKHGWIDILMGGWMDRQTQISTNFRHKISIQLKRPRNNGRVQKKTFESSWIPRLNGCKGFLQCSSFNL